MLRSSEIRPIRAPIISLRIHEDLMEIGLRVKILQPGEWTLSIYNGTRIIDDFYVTVRLGEKFSPRDTNLELHYRFIVVIVPPYVL